MDIPTDIKSMQKKTQFFLGRTRITLWLQGMGSSPPIATSKTIGSKIAHKFRVYRTPTRYNA